MSFEQVIAEMADGYIYSDLRVQFNGEHIYLHSERASSRSIHPSLLSLGNSLFFENTKSAAIRIAPYKRF